MNKFEQNSSNKEKFSCSDRVKEIALAASQMLEFQEAVGNAKNYIDAGKAVRTLLREHFPEISELPEPKCEGSPVGNEFLIAKHILGLLYEK